MHNIHKNNTFELDTYIFSADWIHSNEFLDFNIFKQKFNRLQSRHHLLSIVSEEICRSLDISRWSWKLGRIVDWRIVVEVDTTESRTPELVVDIRWIRCSSRRRSEIFFRSRDPRFRQSARVRQIYKLQPTAKQTRAETKFSFQEFLGFLKLRFNLIRSRSLTERNVSGISLFYRTEFDFRFSGC